MHTIFRLRPHLCVSRRNCSLRQVRIQGACADSKPQYPNAFRQPKSIRYQQPVDGSKSKASLANKGCGIDFSTILRISTVKSDVDDLPRPRMRTNNRSMLLASHFTLPIATRTSEGSNGIKEWAAPANRSVAKHHYMPIVGVHAIQKFRTGQIESVSNHDCCPAHVRRLALRITTRGASGSRRGEVSPKIWARCRRISRLSSLCSATTYE